MSENHTSAPDLTTTPAMPPEMRQQMIDHVQRLNRLDEADGVAGFGVGWTRVDDLLFALWAVSHEQWAAEQVHWV